MQTRQPSPNHPRIEQESALCVVFFPPVDFELVTQNYGLVIHISVAHPDVLSPSFPYVRITQLSPLPGSLQGGNRWPLTQ